MGNRTLEATLVRSIMRMLRELPRARVRKRRGGMSNAGEPDIEACIAGLHFEFEVKRPGERLTPLQSAKLMQWRRAGAVAGRVESKLDAMKMISKGIRDFLNSRHVNELVEIESIVTAKINQSGGLSDSPTDD